MAARAARPTNRALERARGLTNPAIAATARALDGERRDGWFGAVVALESAVLAGIPALVWLREQMAAMEDESA